MMLRDTSGTSDASRHAALLLHAMPAQDRSWALAQLPESQQALLAGLLKELQELGIPRDHKLIDQAVASMTTPQAPTATSLLRLDPAGVHALSELLGKEPALLVARLLACGPWTWEDELLTKLAPAQRRQVEKLRAELPTRLEAQPLKDALVQKIEEHLFQAAPLMQAPTPAPRRSFGLSSALRRTGTST
jgi:hypothetical protein